MNKLMIDMNKVNEMIEKLKNEITNVENRVEQAVIHSRWWIEQEANSELNNLEGIKYTLENLNQFEIEGGTLTNCPNCKINYD